MLIVDPFFIGSVLVGLALLRTDRPQSSQPRSLLAWSKFAKE